MGRTYVDIANDIGRLVMEKQIQYGDSVTKSAEILSILYPNGVPAEQFGNMLLLVRVLDKMSRLAQQASPGVDRGGESPWQDMAGYALLALSALEKSASQPVADERGCAHCGCPLSTTHFQDVPGRGDVCMPCHGELFPVKREVAY